MASSKNDVEVLSPHRHADVNHALISPKPKQTAEDNMAGWSPKDIIKQAGLLAKAFFWDVLLPTGNIMLGWSIVMLLLLMYLATVLPYAVAFKIDFSDLGNPLSVLDLTINLIFMFDIWMNFHTAVLGHDGRLISDRHGIASRYLKGWFWFDLVSSFPFEQVLVLHNSLPSLVMLLKVVRVARIVRMIKLLRLLRIARLTRLPQVMLRLESLIGRVPLQLMGLLGSAFLLLHWAACVWHYLSWAQDNANNWVYHNGLEQADNFERYVTSLYWSVATIAAVGYGDVVGHSVLEKIVAMIAMLIGATVFGYFMGSMTVMVSALNASSARMATKRQAVNDFLRHRRVPKALSDKVRAYYSYVVEREVAADEADIITGLSSSLRTQVVLHLYAEALEKVPFFRGQHPQFITSVVTFLKLEYYAPGDIVVRQGDMGSEMYFVGEGALEVRLYEDERGSPIARAAYKRKGTNEAPQAAAAAPADNSAATTSHADQAFEAWQQQGQASLHGSRGSSAFFGAVGAAARATWQAAAAVLSWLPFMGWCSSNSHADSLARSGYVSQSCRPSRSGGVGGCSSGGTPLSVDESLLHEFTLFRGEKKAREKYTYVDELGDRPYKRINLLRPGEYFGELSCLLGEARNATVVASTYCELYSLSRADLEEVLQQWPELAEEFEAMVQTAAEHKEAQAPTSLHGVNSSPLGTAGGPLTKWNVFKAAYSHSLFGQLNMQAGMTADGTAAAQQHQQQQVMTQHHAESQVGVQQQQQQQQGMRQSSMSARGAVPMSASSTSRQNSQAWPNRRNSFSKDSGAHRLASLCAPSPSLGQRLQTGGRSSSLGVQSTSAAAAAVAAAEQQQQWQQRAGVLGGLRQESPTSSSGAAAAAAAAADESADPQQDADAASAVAEEADAFAPIRPVSFAARGRSVSLRQQELTRRSMPPPPLARNLSMGSIAIPAAAAVGIASPNLARRSAGGLHRSSVSFSRRNSLSLTGAAGPLEQQQQQLARASWLPRQGTGLFSGTPGRYLFPYGLNRNGSLAAPAAAATVDDDQFLQYGDEAWSVSGQHQDSQDSQF